MPKQRTKRKAAPGNLTEATIGDVFETETTALPPLNRHRAKKRRSTRTQPQRADLPDNTIINSSNNNLPTSPSANDIAEALFAKLHSSSIHLVKDNNVMPTSEISAILNPSLQTGHASSTQSMQISFITSIPPLTTVSNGNSDKHDSSLASFQLPLSSDPDVIPAEQFHSSSANVDTPYACHMLKHSIPIYFHVSCRAFLRRLFDLTMSHTSPHYRIKLNSEPRLELKLWDLVIKDFNGKSCFLYNKWVSSDVLKLYSDAAGTHGGFAAVFGSKWFAGEWPQEIRNLPITIKELFPIVLAIDIWG
ncbi:unnamed protein product [Mytilus edulis]|uniref:Uncharacterized protein n=1 Tax=Mytilus edulis TaxID=6550 RepID=A0A8S3PT28_MYTED|nr:unnamed protein product [Mytilus edulis]